MSIPRLLSQIFSGVWLIDPQKARGYFPVIESILAGNWKNNEHADDDIQIKVNPYFVQVNNAAAKRVQSTWDINNLRDEDVPEGSLVVVPIQGAISKYNYCGTPGTNTIASFLKKVDGMKNVSAVMLMVDSPGGEADGTRNLAEIVNGFSKPVTAFVDGMAASGAYWIISGADKIITNNDTDEVGSIGTFCSFADVRGWVNYEGIKFHEVYATKSINKNKAYKDALEGKYDLLKEQLDVINESFINGVKEGRGDLITANEVFTGTLYFAKDAINIGLIDEIGNFEHALQVTNELVNNSNSHTFLNSKAMNFKNSIKKLFGFKVEEEVEVTQERVDELDTKVADQLTRITTLESELETANGNLTAANATIAQKDTTIAELTEKLSKRPAAPVPGAKTNETDKIEKPEATDGWNESDKQSAKEAGFEVD